MIHAFVSEATIFQNKNNLLKWLQQKTQTLFSKCPTVQGKNRFVLN